MCLSVRLLSGSQSDVSCVVAVVNRLDAVNISNGFTYRSQLTPVITEVSPRRGGTAGGTRLTITGSGFRCGEVCSVQMTQWSDTPRLQTTGRELSAQLTKYNCFCFIGRLRVHWLSVSQLPHSDFTYETNTEYNLKIFDLLRYL